MTLSFTVRASTLPLSPNLQAVLLAKILMYEKKFKKSGAVSVYVINAPLVAEAFSRLIGETGGHINIKLVKFGKGIPDEKFDLVYFNDIRFLAEAKKYATRHHSVLVTGKKKLVEKGVTLGTSAEKGRPQFYLNLTASFSIDLDWEPKVLKIVGTFR